VHPVISEGAATALVQSYLELRRAGDDPRGSEKRITATTRQLESLIRLGEAHARMRCAGAVEPSDVAEAGRLMREALKTAAVDPRTGKLDLGLLTTGVSEGARRMQADLRRALEPLVRAAGTRGLRWGDAVERVRTQSSVALDQQEFQAVVRELEQEGIIRVVGERERRTLRVVEGA
jgi:DNA replication licensing factor MCM4